MTEQYFSGLRIELFLTMLILALLVGKVLAIKQNPIGTLTLISVFLISSIGISFMQNESGYLFGTMFRTNSTILFEKAILLAGTFIVFMLGFEWMKKQKHFLEFCMLLLSTLLGMCFMISSGNFLMFFLGLELATIPLAALASFDLDEKKSSEAGMKLILSSAFASAILLFGISFIYGTTGSVSFDTIASAIDGNNVQKFGFICILTGFAFKISAVPFHFWTADVYEGAPVAITSYLSVVSKGAAIFVLMPVLYHAFGRMSSTYIPALILLSTVTIITGNLFALRQKSMKRFLAFSTVTQAGYLLLGITGNNTEAGASVVYFMLIYIFSNLGAFTVVSILQNRTGRDDIGVYKGLYKTNPTLSMVLLLALFSLAGIPPAAGFFGKLFLLSSAAGAGYYVAVIIASVNMVVSLYYYLNIVKMMFVDEPEITIEKLKPAVTEQISLFICCCGILVIGFIPAIYEYIYNLSAAI